MGFWNDGARSQRSRSRSRSRSTSRRKRASSHDGTRSLYSRPSAARSASSFIESLTGYNANSRAATPRRPTPSTYSSSRGWFGNSSSHSNNRYSYGSSSRAGPRSGLVNKIRRWLRDLYHYMKRHPVKVFFLVIMPLITGGALTKILSTVGIRLPTQLERMVGSGMNRGYTQTERFYSRGGARDFGGGTALPGMGGIGVLGDSVSGMMKMAKMFM